MSLFFLFPLSRISPPFFPTFPIFADILSEKGRFSFVSLPPCRPTTFQTQDMAASAPQISRFPAFSRHFSSYFFSFPISRFLQTFFNRHFDGRNKCLALAGNSGTKTSIFPDFFSFFSSVVLFPGGWYLSV